MTKNLYDERYVEVERCVQKSLWHVPNANSVITILPRIRKLILTEWKPRSIADSARLTHYIRKPSKRGLKDGREQSNGEQSNQVF